MSLAVLIPACNEAERLGATLGALAHFLPGARVLVVVNGSTDDTGARAARAGAAVLHLPGRGYAAALGEGYRWCRAQGLRRVLQLDADGQHPPEAAPRLLAALDRADLATGSRQATGSPGALPRRLGNAALAAALRLSTGARLEDVMSGNWALGERALALFAERFPLPGGAADANARAFALCHGLEVVEVPVYMPVRPGGVSMHAGLQGASNFAASALSLALALRERPRGAGRRR